MDGRGGLGGGRGSEQKKLIAEISQNLFIITHNYQSTPSYLQEAVTPWPLKKARE